MPIGKKQARLMLAQLKEARRAATMERMSVGWPGEIVTVSGTDALPPPGITPDEFIKERTRFYRQSWIIHPLDCVIAELEEAAK